MSDKMKFVPVILIIICTCNGDINRRVVRLTSNNQIKFFSAPLAKELIQSWIDVQKGVYPKVTPITDVIDIGENITLLIYFKEPNKIYDVSITDCWAYDNDDPKATTNKVNLHDIKTAQDSRVWKKVKYYEGNDPTTVLLMTMRAFKFPDSDKVFLTCNIMLCYRKCTYQDQILIDSNK